MNVLSLRRNPFARTPAPLASRLSLHSVDREDVDITGLERGGSTRGHGGDPGRELCRRGRQAESEREEASGSTRRARGYRAQAAAAGCLSCSCRRTTSSTVAKWATWSDEPAPLGPRMALSPAVLTSTRVLVWSVLSGSLGSVARICRDDARLGAERGSLSVVDDQVGSPTWTADLARGLVWLLEEGASGRYHLTNSDTTSWCGFAREIFDLAGLDVAVRAIPTADFPRPATRPAFGILRNERWLAEGHQPLRSWREALASYLVARGRTEHLFSPVARLPAPPADLHISQAADPDRQQAHLLCGGGHSRCRHHRDWVTSTPRTRYVKP